MSQISYNRASHQHINPNLRCGKASKPVHPARPSSAYLDSVDYNNLNHAIDLIRKAQMASSHASCVVNLSASFAVIREIVKSIR